MHAHISMKDALFLLQPKKDKKDNGIGTSKNRITPHINPSRKKNVQHSTFTQICYLLPLEKAKTQAFIKQSGHITQKC